MQVSLRYYNKAVVQDHSDQEILSAEARILMSLACLIRSTLSHYPVTLLRVVPLVGLSSGMRPLPCAFDWLKIRYLLPVLAQVSRLGVIPVALISDTNFKFRGLGFTW